jgi:hypothetical protein
VFVDISSSQTVPRGPVPRYGTHRAGKSVVRSPELALRSDRIEYSMASVGIGPTGWEARTGDATATIVKEARGFI